MFAGALDKVRNNKACNYVYPGYRIQPPVVKFALYKYTYKCAGAGACKGACPGTGAGVIAGGAGIGAGAIAVQDQELYDSVGRV